MDQQSVDTIPQSGRPYRIVDLNYVTLYMEDFSEAVAFYAKVFGPPQSADDEGGVRGWRMGSTWLTLLPGHAGTHTRCNPRNTEFAIQVSAPEEVDALYGALVEAGAKACMKPKDTRMYEPVRFSCVDDPFGVRIDIYCPVTEQMGPSVVQ